MNEPVILAIDTSTTNIVIGICRGDEILCSETFKCEQHQSKHLLTFIDTCLKKTTLKLQDIDAFATTTGPGSFTGVRICLGTMKGLAFSLSKPLIGIPTLLAMAASSDPSKTIIPTISARKGYVYSASYEHTNGTWVETASAKMISIEDFSKESPANALIIGEMGNSNFASIYGKTLCEIALKKYSHKQFEDVFLSEPLYIQKTAAEGYV